jgi:hypothetical protein
LIELDFNYNQINEVTFIPKMEALERLKLGRNQLAEFPVLLNASSTLKELYIFDNEITFIPGRLIATLTKLEYLDIGLNPLVTLPNFCPMSPTGLQLRLEDQQFACDWRMAYIKMADMSGQITYSNIQPDCISPPRLASKVWAATSITELIETGILLNATFLTFNVSFLMSFHNNLYPLAKI